MVAEKATDDVLATNVPVNWWPKRTLAHRATRSRGRMSGILPNLAANRCYSRWTSHSWGANAPKPPSQWAI